MADLRVATDADFLAFYHREAPPHWVGMCVQEDERIVGFGCVIWTDLGNAVAFVDRRQPISAFTMHRAVKRGLSAVKQAGEEYVYAACDERMPRAAAWLKRLGFKPMDDNPELWRVTL